MPAAAVIPAPIAYIKVVAVKKLVVGSWAVGGRFLSRDCSDRTGPISPRWRVDFTGWPYTPGTFTLKKLECSKQVHPPEYLCME